MHPRQTCSICQRPIPLTKASGYTKFFKHACEIPSTKQLAILPGTRFGKWTVVQMLPVRNQRAVMYEVLCDCGVRAAVAGRTLSQGRSGSCLACGKTTSGLVRAQLASKAKQERDLFLKELDTLLRLTALVESVPKSEKRAAREWQEETLHQFKAKWGPSYSNT